MNGKRPADPGPARPMKKGKKQVAAELSDAVTEETVRKQVAEAWSCRTPFSHGNRGAVREERPREEVWGGPQPPPTPALLGSSQFLLDWTSLGRRIHIDLGVWGNGRLVN